MSKEFRRPDSHKRKKLSNSWRKPRGLDNKVKHGYKGYVRKVKIGYGTPKDKPTKVIVSNEKDILGLKSMKNYDAIFSSTLGNRKKVLLLKIAENHGIKISNIKADFSQKMEEEMKRRKEASLSHKQKKEEKQKELDKKAKEKESKKEEKLDAKVDDKEKKDADKAEKDKVLIKKEGI